MIVCDFFFFKQKTAYEMRISDWSSDVCSSDLFDATDFGAFLELLPKEQDGLTLRHAVEVRHESFACAEFVELARALGVAIVEAYHDSYPLIAEATAAFAYLRLQQSREEEPTGYYDALLDDQAEQSRVVARAREVLLFR